jgi:hypothetical protein
MSTPSFVDRHFTNLHECSNERDYFDVLRDFHNDVTVKHAGVREREKKNICAFWLEFKRIAREKAFDNIIPPEILGTLNTICPSAGEGGAGARRTTPEPPGARRRGAGVKAGVGAGDGGGGNYDDYDELDAIDPSLKMKKAANEFLKLNFDFFRTVITNPTGRTALNYLQKAVTATAVLTIGTAYAGKSIWDIGAGMYGFLKQSFYAGKQNVTTIENIILFIIVITLLWDGAAGIEYFVFGPGLLLRANAIKAQLDRLSPADWLHLLHYAYSQLHTGSELERDALALYNGLGAHLEERANPGDIGNLLVYNTTGKAYQKISEFVSKVVPSLEMKKFESFAWKIPETLSRPSFVETPNNETITSVTRNLSGLSGFWGFVYSISAGTTGFVGALLARNSDSNPYRAWANVLSFIGALIVIAIQWNNESATKTSDKNTMSEAEPARDNEFGRWLRAMFGKNKRSPTRRRKQASSSFGKRTKQKRASVKRTSKRVSSFGKRTKKKRASSFGRKHRSAKKKVERRKK